MTREEKTRVVEDLADRLSTSSHIYLADISGLDAKKANDLRRACFKKEVRLSVVKNTLLNLAMDSTDKDFGQLSSVLQGNTSIMTSETGKTPAQIIKEFRKKNEKPVLKGALVEEGIYLGDENLEKLSNIKSRDELIGDVIELLQSPAKQVISALQSSGNKLTGLLKSLSEKGEA